MRTFLVSQGRWPGDLAAKAHPMVLALTVVRNCQFRKQAWVLPVMRLASVFSTEA